MSKTKTIFIILILMATVSWGQSESFFERVEFTTEMLKGINTAGSEISPAIVKEELYFSAREDEATSERKYKQQVTRFYDIYKTKINADGYIDTTRQRVPGFGNFYHEGPVSWCSATGELWVTLSNVLDGDTLKGFIKEELVRLRLVIMHEVNGRWTIKEEFPFNQDKFHFAHPAVSSTGDTLVFSSDMPGGYGKTDLFMSIRKDSVWSKPRNLGTRINTHGNEMFPVFGPGGLLLFSSDRHEGNLGHLDIYYTSLAGNKTPVHLGETINSPDDDFGLIIDKSGRFGYFSSNRKGSGSDDIYLVKFSSLYENLAGKVFASHNGLPLRNAVVHLEDCNGSRLNTTRTDIGGNFIFEAPIGNCYQFEVEREGYLPERMNLVEGEMAEFRMKQKMNYQVLALDAENAIPVSQAVIVCNEQKWETNSEGFAQMDMTMGNSCDFKVTKSGYFDYILDFNGNLSGTGTSDVDTIMMFRKTANKIITLGNLVYYRDMWRIMPESENELNILVKLMKDNPGIRAEIGTHTDSRLADDYNLWLSQKRSDSIMEYMIERGVKKEQLISRGYGELQLLNKCGNFADCSEEEHQVNRRTEFKILSF
jgi:outer membrane protein OmpA-like peptidoglycan-associated protein